MGNISERVEKLSESQRLLLALKEARTKLEAVERSKTEPIAIIGLGCRFPGGAHDPDSYWRLMRDGVDAIVEIPRDRWNIDAYYDPDPDAQGKMYIRMGGFLQQQVDQFDPVFFGISAREAASIDPQQRLLLEVSWEALERAGIAPKSLAGSRTGVFVGIGQNDYGQLQLSSDPTSISVYDGTGNGFCFASGRLSYILGLQGPSVSMDTACSSSLVAIHLACKSLRTGECDMALTGGVQLMLSPGANIFLSRSHALSPDGRCKTFDAAANGFTRGEGCGILVLKRLSDAEADRDNILAVIRGSAMNHDGPSSGLTVPNGSAQQVLIRQALKNAKVEPSEINYVEAHGTGTPLGDPIEVRALGAVLGEGRSPDNPVIIGSVKTNIGHLEASAGVAGLIKVVLSLQHNEIPAHLHFKQPSPYINWDELPVKVPTSPIPWFPGEKRRLAGVSSFGLSGTNAHIVLEEAPVSKPVQAEVERPLHLLTLSAKTQEALLQLARKYENHLAVNPSLDIKDICYTANAGRTHFSDRLALIASSSAQLREQLANFSSRQETAQVFQGHSSSLPKVAFLFTGQGSQYVGMGRQLYENAPVFRAALDQCDEILRPYLGQSLLQVLYPEPGESSPLDQTAYTQPALFAIEYALVQLWKSWGIHPDAVMGHSVGEYVAATVAGVLSLQDGLKLIAHRSRLMQSLPAGGEMVAVFASEKEIREITKTNDNIVGFAAFNGPRNTVISGSAQAVQAVCADLEAAGIKTKKLQTSHAFHSPLMEPILAQFAEVANQVSYAAPKIPIISNLTGSQLTFEEISADYWCRHLRSGVQFAKSLNTLHERGYEVFVEIGPKPTLLGMGRNCLPEEVGVWLPSLRSGQEDWRVLLQSLGELYVRGADVDWSGFDRDYGGRRVMLPTYPFQRQRYWVEKAHSDYQQALPSQPQIQTSIVNLLHHGNVKQLAQQLEGASNFSQEQMKMLPQLLEALVTQHRQEVQAAVIKDWLYEVQWQQMPQRLQTPEQEGLEYPPGTWVVFADASGVGQALGEILQRRGQNCVLVYTGEAYQTLKTGTWSINPTSPEDYERLFQEVLGTGVPPLKGIIHLWSLEAALPDALCITTLEQAQNLGSRSVLYLLQTVVKHYESPSPRLWLVTRGAVPAGSELPGVAQAPLWGLGKVLALEHPELWGGMLDLAPEYTGDEATELLAEIENSFGEDHIAFRNGDRYVARLVPKQQEESKQVRLHSDGTYLISGGLGALGLKVARLLMSLGARQLVLTGRNTASDEAQSTLRELEQLGAKVFLQKVDVSDEADMVKLLETVQATMPPLRGIVHAAGVLDDGILQQQSWERFSRVMAPKVRGAWNLHTLTDGLPLDFFVVFSSAASLLGSPGQGNYAAANSFMDVLAHYRRSQGLPGLSINWGPWAEVGMAASKANRHEAANAMGLDSIAPELGLQVLKQLLQVSSQIGVLPIDWSILRQQLSLAGGQLPPLLFEFTKTETQEQTELASVRRSDILPRLSQAQNSDRLDLLVAYLQSAVIKVLGFDGSLILNPQQGLVELGLDSLMAVQLKNAIATDLNLNVPLEKFIDGSTIVQLAELLLDELAIITTRPSVSPSSPLENDLEVIKLPVEVCSTSASLASAATSSQDSWIEGEL
ncbi:beta-ketoacyl synthase (plasmid) [Scytonema sp. HK-05]|uniref:type I polyketide synthase n=1 Tax=Scytonema sp. HK-05 TaxID=1137095 RepID=UPI000935B117|nr:type I polyketide synthase [Scytonema sp. HK-05]OKH59465.1 short-chain dehydrogenase [Scytonema sp. HK-05]BAY50153.1 beta-ketoacyl synthase [Scytonema sp. HK-05]